MQHDPGYHVDTQRLEAFSDGVFAIAITLLILEISVPDLKGGESLTRALLERWPSYFGYVVSFLTIGVMWINHHYMFKDIERTDHTLLLLNLLLLMTVAFLPFPTAVLAQYVRDEAHRLQATLTYGVTLVVIAIVFNALWLYASRNHRLIDEHVTEARVRSRTIRYLPGAPLYALGVPLAFVHPWISLGLYAGLALFFLLPLSE